MTTPLSEALKDPDVIEALKKNPDSFSFKEAPYAVVTMLSWPPHTIISEADYQLKEVLEGIPTTFPVVGAMANMLEILSTRLNFTWLQGMPTDISWGVRAPNGTWSGMMGQVFRREVDFGLGPFTIIDSRYEDVDMCYPFFYDTLGLMMGRGSAEIDPWGFLMPFTPAVWGFFFAMLFGIALVHLILEGPNHSSSSVLSQYGHILFEYCQPPMDHAMARRLWRSWQRPLIGSWVLVALLLNSSYGGILKAMMALRFIPHPVQTLKDLVYGHPDMKIIIEHRTAFLAAIGRFPSGDVKAMNDAGEAGRYVDLRMSEFMEYSDIVRRGDHAQIFDTSTALQYSARDFTEKGHCDFYIARETFMPTMYAMISQKHSPLSPAMDAIIQRVVESGLYKYWAVDSLTNMSACLRPPMKVLLNEAINFGNIWGLAVITGAGMLLASLAFICEIVTYRILSSN